MAKLEQLVTPLELLAAIRAGALKSEIVKQYKTSDQELAVMLQPLYRAGKMTKDEFNEFFMGRGAKPPSAPAAKTAAADVKPESEPALEPSDAAAAGPALGAEAPVKTPEPIEQAPMPGLEHPPAELERAVDQPAPEEAPATAVAPEEPEKPAAETEAKPPTPPEPKLKPVPKPKPPVTPESKPKAAPAAKPPAAKPKEPPKPASEAAPKPVDTPAKKARPSLKPVPVPRPAATPPPAPKVQPETEEFATPPKEDATLDLITVTVEETLRPLLDESIAAAATTEETLRTILSRLDSIDARLAKIEKKLETG